MLNMWSFGGGQCMTAYGQLVVNVQKVTITWSASNYDIK